MILPTPVVDSHRPLTKTEWRIVSLLVQPESPSNREVAAVMGWKPKSIAIAVERIAQKVPGTLPPRIRVMLWGRGAPSVALHGYVAPPAENTVAAPLGNVYSSGALTATVIRAPHQTPPLP